MGSLNVSTQQGATPNAPAYARKSALRKVLVLGASVAVAASLQRGYQRLELRVRLFLGCFDSHQHLHAGLHELSDGRDLAVMQAYMLFKGHCLSLLDGIQLVSV